MCYQLLGRLPSLAPTPAVTLDLCLMCLHPDSLDVHPFPVGWDWFPIELSRLTLSARSLQFLGEQWPEKRPGWNCSKLSPMLCVCIGSQLHLPSPHRENRGSLCLISQATLRVYMGKGDFWNLLIHLCAPQGTHHMVWQEDIVLISQGAWSCEEENIDGAGVRGEHCWSVVLELAKEVGLVHNQRHWPGLGAWRLHP